MNEKNKLTNESPKAKTKTEIFIDKALTILIPLYLIYQLGYGIGVFLGRIGL